MKILNKQDLRYALITGLTTGLIAWQVLRYLKVAPPGQVPFAWLLFVVPVLWIVGVQFGYFLGMRIGFFTQFGKFVAIGFTNFAVDAGILNLLLALTGISGGAWYAVFKTISFIIAVCHSYFWNRRWTFQPLEQSSGSEFAKFMAVMLLSLLVNVSVATLVVHLLPSSVVNANIGAIVGSATALVFSFVGFRVVVFRDSRSM